MLCFSVFLSLAQFAFSRQQPITHSDFWVLQLHALQFLNIGSQLGQALSSDCPWERGQCASEPSGLPTHQERMFWDCDLPIHFENKVTGEWTTDTRNNMDELL